MQKWEEVGIWYAQKYEPYYIYDEYGDKIRSPHFTRRRDGRVLDLKEGKVTAVDHYYNILSNELSHLKDKDKVCIAVVPSHDKDKEDGAVHEIARRLCENEGFIDATGCLQRTETIQKLANGGDRSQQTHLNSIKVVNKRIIKDKNVIILDDVTTTGNSLLACKELIEGSGASKGVCISIARTIHHE